MDPVVDHSPRSRHPAGPREAKGAQDGADHAGKGRDQGNQHWQQAHWQLSGA
jgi:hypothetical protein